MGSLICVDNFFKFGVPSQKCKQTKCFGYFALYAPVQNPPVLLLTAEQIIYLIYFCWEQT